MLEEKEKIRENGCEQKRMSCFDAMPLSRNQVKQGEENSIETATEQQKGGKQ